MNFTDPYGYRKKGLGTQSVEQQIIASKITPQYEITPSGKIVQIEEPAPWESYLLSKGVSKFEVNVMKEFFISSPSEYEINLREGTYTKQTPVAGFEAELVKTIFPKVTIVETLTTEYEGATSEMGMKISIAVNQPHRLFGNTPETATKRLYSVYQTPALQKPAEVSESSFIGLVRASYSGLLVHELTHTKQYVTNPVGSLLTSFWEKNILKLPHGERTLEKEAFAMEERYAQFFLQKLIESKIAIPIEVSPYRRFFTFSEEEAKRKGLI